MSLDTRRELLERSAGEVRAPHTIQEKHIPAEEQPVLW